MEMDKLDIETHQVNHRLKPEMNGNDIDGDINMTNDNLSENVEVKATENIRNNTDTTDQFGTDINNNINDDIKTDEEQINNDGNTSIIEDIQQKN